MITDALESDPESLAPILIVCRGCYQDLKANKVPALSTANHNYLGPVPPELKDLTVVEEAMISLCQAKCWIIQLRDDNSETSVPISQHAVHGHIIIYPQKLTAIAKTLPPPIADVITPICVILVGSKPPTEWLKDKAKPLIMRKEKVPNMLHWLKIHNHLYADIAIDQHTLDELPSGDILPFPIQQIIPNAGINSSTSDYVPGSSLPDEQGPRAPQLSNILTSTI
jgi:hypothetical protein